MRGLVKRILCALICLWELAGPGGSAFAEIQKLKAGTVENFARSVPIATVWIEPAMLTPERMQMEQKPAGKVVFSADAEGNILAEHVQMQEGVLPLGSLKLTFPDAAVGRDGERADVHLNFREITVVGKKGSGEYLDRLMLCCVGNSPGEAFAIAPLSIMQKKHFGIVYDLEMVIDTEEEEGFLFTVNGINKSRMSGKTNEFSKLIDAETYAGYSESVIVEEGLLSRLCFPKTSPLVVKGSRFTASSTTVPEYRYESGFAFLGNTKGTKIRVISSAGKNTDPLKIYIMPGGTSHLVSLITDKGGQVSLRADGHTYSSGTQGGWTEYDVPNGKRVSIVLEPDAGCAVDWVTFNGKEIRPEEQPGYSVEERKCMFFLDVDAAEDLVITVRWKQDG